MIFIIYFLLLLPFALVVDMLSAQLTLYNGEEKFSNKKSFFIILVLYVSHFFSAWVSLSVWHASLCVLILTCNSM